MIQLDLGRCVCFEGNETRFVFQSSKTENETPKYNTHTGLSAIYDPLISLGSSLLLGLDPVSSVRQIESLVTSYLPESSAEILKGLQKVRKETGVQTNVIFSHAVEPYIHTEQPSRRSSFHPYVTFAFLVNLTNAYISSSPAPFLNIERPFKLPFHRTYNPMPPPPPRRRR